MQSIVTKILNAIRSDEIITKHILNHTWISGSNTEVYPITLWSHNVEIQVDIDKNVFKKAIDKIVNRYPELFCYGYFHKSDDSCPSYIGFTYTETTIKELLANI